MATRWQMILRHSRFCSYSVPHVYQLIVCNAEAVVDLLCVSVSRLHERWLKDCTFYRDLYKQLNEVGLQPRINWVQVFNQKQVIHHVHHDSSNSYYPEGSAQYHSKSPDKAHCNIWYYRDHNILEQTEWL